MDREMHVRPIIDHVTSPGVFLRLQLKKQASGSELGGRKGQECRYMRPGGGKNRIRFAVSGVVV